MKQIIINNELLGNVEYISTDNENIECKIINVEDINPQNNIDSPKLLSYNELRKHIHLYSECYVDDNFYIIISVKSHQTSKTTINFSYKLFKIKGNMLVVFDQLYFKKEIESKIKIYGQILPENYKYFKFDGSLYSDGEDFIENESYQLKSIKNDNSSAIFEKISEGTRKKMGKNFTFNLIWKDE